MTQPGGRRAGTARPTLADVAREAGVSTALVSIVMRGVPGASDATRARVQAVADGMGYVRDERARKLRQSSSRLIGVTFDLQQAFHGDLVEHLYGAAAARGYDLAISAVAPTRDEDVAIQALLRERCEVAVLLGSALDDAVLASTAQRVPLLLVARRSEVDGVSSVHSDDAGGVGLAVDHLVSLGHRRLVHVDGADAPGADDRRRGFALAVERHGLTSQAQIVPGGPTEHDGSRAAEALLYAPARPSAVVAFNDRCAAGVLDLLVRRQVDVPGDVSVVGYDDSRLAVGPHAQMSTISQNAAEMAEAAIDGALDLLDGGDPREVVLAPHLVARSTSGPASGTELLD
ncbi:LacI family DNA-binding transcriptional regulator [Aeromicrobium endophyticum]|uniref:LacI family transcriptional regulator n=1 Tax=Aeromicrobium endophyticum TaxID=2292704 RepID=A0A371P456_9ACTN|nr:LacI family DNA-binding transcriptional regulator [Aeromicrobium endophyticum]REK70719.1 LacI family transcriptional regulator [Aeromicrobium endophyticum]